MDVHALSPKSGKKFPDVLKDMTRSIGRVKKEASPVLKETLDDYIAKDKDINTISIVINGAL